VTQKPPLARTTSGGFSFCTNYSQRLIYSTEQSKRVYNDRMNTQSHTFRLRAIQNEQRAAAASDPNIKAEWGALAIEWHALANAISQSSGEGDQIDFA
jgi:hypothetical protein